MICKISSLCFSSKINFVLRVCVRIFFVVFSMSMIVLDFVDVSDGFFSDFG